MPSCETDAGTLSGTRESGGDTATWPLRLANGRLEAAELEGRQKLWRPLILAALGVLVVETWLAGRLDRARPVRAEAA